jgi:hypothetical protein
MADCGVSISSVNLSGLTTEVTFLPQTGGTAVNLGNQIFPFNYVADYYYGTYNCYVPLYAYTYSILILGSNIQRLFNFNDKKNYRTLSHKNPYETKSLDINNFRIKWNLKKVKTLFREFFFHSFVENFLVYL